jgi:hypothetical protein
MAVLSLAWTGVFALVGLFVLRLRLPRSAAAIKRHSKTQ